MVSRTRWGRRTGSSSLNNSPLCWRSDCRPVTACNSTFSCSTGGLWPVRYVQECPINHSAEVVLHSSLLSLTASLMWRCHVLIRVFCFWIKLLCCNMSISLCLLENSFKVTQLGFKSEHRTHTVLYSSSGNDDTPSSLISNDTLCSQSVVWSRIVLISHQMHRFDCLCPYCKQNGPLSLFFPTRLL